MTALKDKSILKKSSLIEIGLLLLGVGIIYAVIKNRTLKILSVDKQNRSFTYKWKGDEYKWEWDYQDDGWDMMEEIDNEHIITQKFSNPPMVNILYGISTLDKNGDIIKEKTLVTDTIRF